MFSKPIFKQTNKASNKLWFIFTAILGVMCAMIIIVFDPTMIESMMGMLEGTPMAEMAGGFMDGMGSITGMLSGQFYGMLAVILPMIFIIITANSLIAKKVDDGSMAYLLSTPTKRGTVVKTQAVYMITSVLYMFVTTTIVGLVSVFLVHGGDVEFNVMQFIMMNLGAFLLMFAISGISFMFSCIFNLSKNALAFGAGVPIAFFIFQILSQTGDSLEVFKYLSLNTLYDPSAISSGGSFAIQFVVLAVVGVVCYLIGMRKFEKKDLPL